MNSLKKLRAFSKVNNKRQYYYESIMAILLLILPLVYQFYKYLPNVESFEFAGLNISSFQFSSIDTFFWFLMQKVVPLFVLIIWFTSSKSWWRYSLLVPILFLFTQTIQLILAHRYMDEYEFFYALPLAMPLLIALVLLSKKINLYLVNHNLKKELQIEIDGLLKAVSNSNNDVFIKLEAQLLRLKDKKYHYSSARYLEQLLNIRVCIERERVGISFNSNNLDEAKNISQNNKGYADFYVTFFILLSPMLFYLYLLIPDSPEVYILNNKFTLNYQESFQFVGWLIFTKLNYILLYTIWYIYNKSWWRYSLLPLLAYDTYLLFIIINDEIQMIDNPITLKHELIIVPIFIVTFYLLGKILEKKSLSLIDKFAFETDELIERISEWDQKSFKSFRHKLSNIQNNKSKMNEKEYLYKLIALQESIILMENTFLKE